VELELGYKINDNMFITGNLFDITITNTIYYFAITATDANFYNGQQSGSRGFELEYKVKSKRAWLNANYAYYNVSGKNYIDLYAVPGNNKASLSAPQHRININSGVRIGSNFSINPSFNILSSRYGFAQHDANDNKVLKNYNPSVYMNLFLNNSNFLTKGLTVGVGCYDIFDQKQMFIQPYDGDHTPLPGLSREIMLRISYGIHY
jgi:hypothetical protein